MGFNLFVLIRDLCIETVYCLFKLADLRGEFFDFGLIIGYLLFTLADLFILRIKLALLLLISTLERIKIGFIRRVFGVQVVIKLFKLAVALYLRALAVPELNVAFIA